MSKIRRKFDVTLTPSSAIHPSFIHSFIGGGYQTPPSPCLLTPAINKGTNVVRLRIKTQCRPLSSMFQNHYYYFCSLLHPIWPLDGRRSQDACTTLHIQQTNNQTNTHTPTQKQTCKHRWVGGWVSEWVNECCSFELFAVPFFLCACGIRNKAGWDVCMYAWVNSFLLHTIPLTMTNQSSTGFEVVCSVPGKHSKHESHMLWIKCLRWKGVRWWWW